ncbi:MAG: hypothetical protein JKY53_04925 [Flavobacteriales bacterium]|nr:hypothetical protein [Flavobacteriales bacterium]
MRFSQNIGLFFLLVIIGCYSIATVATMHAAENGIELANFPFDSEEQEEESKEGKEKEKEKENEEDIKELIAHAHQMGNSQLLLNQKRKGLFKHYTSIFVEVFTPPPDYIS